MSHQSIDPLLARVQERTALWRRYAHAAERLTRLPDEVVRSLIELELFRLWIPQRHGGLELDLPRTLQIYEAVAAADGSVGWAVMIGAGGGLFAAYLEADAADRLFAHKDALIAGSGAPDGRAERVAGGYRASGRWRYASGAHYASTFTASCVVTNDGVPAMDADGTPLIRAMAFAPGQVTIIPTWNVSGLRGTGSHDFEVADAFVPEQHTFSVFTDVPRESGPLYRLPFDVLTQLPIAAVALGIARHALQSFAALARSKKSSVSRALLIDDPLTQHRYAESHAQWRFAQARVHALAASVWQRTLAARELSAHELAEITATCCSCLAQLNISIGDLARLTGMTAIAMEHDFARAWRDLQALSAHVAISPYRMAAAGRTLLASSSD
ncbi:MAG: acyl-CoA dehydrogenase family protein [Steroidobacteraceae bacterium]